MPRRRWATLAARLDGAAPATLTNGPFPVQLATLGESPPSGDGWLHEIKWDGYRIAATVVDGDVRLWSRNGLAWTAKLPSVRLALGKLGIKNCAFDGELIAGGGRQADFNTLVEVISGKRADPLTLVLFDVLHVDGYSIERVALLERKNLLQQILGDDPPDGLAYSSHAVGGGDAAFAFAEQREFEGIISKRATRPYVHGRGDDWRKTKALASDEFAVVGYTPPKGSRFGFGSLLLAKPEGTGWVHVGRVGSGFSGEQIRNLMPRLSGGQDTPTVQVVDEGRGSLRGARWFEPRFVVEVNIRGVSTSGLLRQPSLKTVRLDKTPADLRSSDKPNKKRKS